MRITFTAGHQVEMHMVDALTGYAPGVGAEIESLNRRVECDYFGTACLDQCKHTQQYSRRQIKDGLVMGFADNQGMQIGDRMGVTDSITKVIFRDDFKISISTKYAVVRHDEMFSNKVIDSSVMIGDSRLLQKGQGRCNKYFTIGLTDNV